MVYVLFAEENATEKKQTSHKPKITNKREGGTVWELACRMIGAAASSRSKKQTVRNNLWAVSTLRDQ